MTIPIAPASFASAPAVSRARVVEGLPAEIDAVAEQSPVSHRFLRRQWYAAAVTAYGGEPRTLVVERGDAPVFALPLVRLGPAWLRLASVPGCYWPFRSFPAAAPDEGVLDAALSTFAGTVVGVRIGPVYDDDPSAAPLIARARERGWAVLRRRVADAYLLDIAGLRAAGSWPRGSTLRKNRHLEKHLAEHGGLEWRFLSNSDWPGAFDALGALEERSWIAAETDGSDAKFTARGHGAFWRAAAADPVLAGMMQAALLTVDGRPAAFSFDLDTGPLRYAIANSYDPTYAKHSPGKLLYWRNLARAADTGTATVDWGAGDSGYKGVIGAEQGPVIRDWLLLRPGAPALAGRLARRWFEGQTRS